MQVTVHTPDTELNTTNLGLKSIAGQEKRRHLQVETAANQNVSYLQQSASLVRRLQTIVSNLLTAANILIQIDQNVLKAMGRTVPKEA